MRAVSTIRPAYMTATRSVRPATTPRSWLTMTMAMPRSRCSRCSRSRICRWTVTSRAVVASSVIRRSGSHESAIGDHHPLAHASGQLVGDTAGAFSAGSGRPTDASSSTARSRAPTARQPQMLRASPSVSCRPMRTTGLSEVSGSWNTIATRRPQICSLTDRGAERRSTPSRTALPAHLGLRGGDAHQRADQHGLARAGLTDQPQRLAVTECQVDPLEDPRVS